MKEVIFLVDEAPEGGFVAHALGHSVYTEADTWTELKAAVQDAVCATGSRLSARRTSACISCAKR